jgi:hypothetical protein
MGMGFYALPIGMAVANAFFKLGRSALRQSAFEGAEPEPSALRTRNVFATLEAKN